jgi:hypothetical protein
MMEDSEEDFIDEQLTEIERMEYERTMLHAAYDNSYRVITDKVLFQDLIDEKINDGTTALMAYDPFEGIQKDELEKMIDYYIELDEVEYYLRCSELNVILNYMYPKL